MTRCTVAAALAAVLAACGSAGHDEAHVDEEGCEHLESGPASEITASDRLPVCAIRSQSLSV